MNWTEIKQSTRGINTISCQTPLGTFKIKWKTLKKSPEYDVYLSDEYVTYADELEQAKEDAEMYLINVRDNLNDFLS